MPGDAGEEHVRDNAVVTADEDGPTPRERAYTGPVVVIHQSEPLLAGCTFTLVSGFVGAMDGFPEAAARLAIVAVLCTLVWLAASAPWRFRISEGVATFEYLPWGLLKRSAPCPHIVVERGFLHVRFESTSRLGLIRNQAVFYRLQFGNGDEVLRRLDDLRAAGCWVE